MEYFFADIAIQGRIRSGEYPFAVGVLDGPRKVSRGIAIEVGQTADGFATWKLKVGGGDVPGRFVIDNGRFVPVESESGTNGCSDNVYFRESISPHARHGYLSLLSLNDLA